jgi:glycosyltransferase involved in cell wall biosynthesis
VANPNAKESAWMRTNLSPGGLRIGLLGLEDPADVRSYSGTPFHIAHYLRAAGNDVRILGPYPLRYRILVRLYNRLRSLFTGKGVLWERHRLIAGQYPGIIRKYLEESPDLDVLLATSVFYVAGARTGIPLVFWADTTVSGVMGRYVRYQNLSKRTVRRSHEVEQAALTACDMAIFSNQWAADVALNSYDLDPRKVRVINYGANLAQAPTGAELRRLLTLRSPDQIKLIILGFDWQRKGMVKAIEVAGELRKRGLNVQLQILGCRPPLGYLIPDYVSLYGKVWKDTPEGARQLERLLGESHLLILPTEAECAAVVLAEASAFGVPSISTDVGGNASLVRQGQNGILLPVEADVSTWADEVMWMLRDRGSYERFAWRAYDFFHQRLSWSNAIQRFEEAVRDLL